MAGKKAENSVRFAVGTPDEARSATWKLFVHRNEVYLAARAMGKWLKVSLHDSGHWRVAFTKNVDHPDPKRDRAVLKWERPKEIVPGLTPSIAIAVTGICPAQPFIGPVTDSTAIRWVETPHKGRTVWFKVLISRAGYTARELLSASPPNAQIIGQMEKENGEVVWLVAVEQDTTELETKGVIDVMTKTKIHPPKNSSADVVHGARVMSLVSENHPTATTQPTIFDIPLGKENVEIADDGSPRRKLIGRCEERK